jgi:biopolymer transport protein ExbD
MRFLVRKRRAAPAVIIVALIDVLIVLVIFLLVTTTFKQQPALKLALPKSSQGQKAGAGNDDVLVVSIDKQGHLRFGDPEQEVDEPHLRSQLLERAAKQPDLKLAVRADTAAPFGMIVKVMDMAKEAKIKSLSAFTEDIKKP